MGRELQAKHDAEDKARSQSNGGDKQADLLLAAHQQEIDQLEERLRNDHERQKNLLRNKMIEKRRRKNEELRRSQEISRQRELIEQKQEIETAQDKADKKRERNLILEGINKNGDTNIQAIVQEVLEKRHKQETENLIEENKMQRKLSLHESM